MKLSFLGFIIIYILFSSCSCSQIEPNIKCDTKSGCISVQKYLIWVPLRNQQGEPLKSKESISEKYIVIYQDKINIYFDKNLKTIQSSDIARSIVYSDLKLECNDNNDVCNVKEFQQKYSNMKILDKVQNKIGQDASNLCLIIPIIDSSNREAQESMIYICENNLQKLNDLYALKNQLTRLIYRYQLQLKSDIDNAANSVCKKEDLIKTVDSDNNINTIMLRLYSNSLQIFRDPSSLNSMIYQIPVSQINYDIKAQTIHDAIQKGLINSDWDQSFKPKPIDQCCFYVPLKGLLKQTYYCIHYDSPEKFDYNDCSQKSKSWIKEINAVLQLQKIIDYSNLLMLNKQESFDCENVEEVKYFKYIFEKMIRYQDKICDELSAFSSQFKIQKCQENKKAQIFYWIQILSVFNKKLGDSLEVCIKKGALSLERKISAQKSFLQTHESSFLLQRQKHKNQLKDFDFSSFQQDNFDQDQNNQNHYESLDDKKFYSPTEMGSTYDNFYLNLKEGGKTESYETIDGLSSFINIKQKSKYRVKSHRKQQKDQNISQLQNTNNLNLTQQPQNNQGKITGNQQQNLDTLTDPADQIKLAIKREQIRNKLMHIKKNQIQVPTPRIMFDKRAIKMNIIGQKPIEKFPNFLGQISKQASDLNDQIISRDYAEAFNLKSTYSQQAKLKQELIQNQTLQNSTNQASQMFSSNPVDPSNQQNPANQLNIANPTDPSNQQNQANQQSLANPTGPSNQQNPNNQKLLGPMKLVNPLNRQFRFKKIK